MPQPRFESAFGLIDGVNTTFTVSVPYRAMSTAVFINGQLKKPTNSDGWIESSPGTGEVELLEAPLVGDQVQVFFIDTSPYTVEEQVTQITCTILAINTDVKAVIFNEIDTINCNLDGIDKDFISTIQDDTLTAKVVDTFNIIGYLTEVRCE